MKRCAWVNLDNPLMVKYHDEEWGRPVRNDRLHFEMLILEGAQAGLSWETILNRRKGYQKAFAKFDVRKVAKFDKRKQASLIKDPGIIRNRLKIAAAVTNAQLFMKVQEEFGTFDKFIWSFVNNKPIKKRPRSSKDYLPTSAESDALSKELKMRGFKFVGSVIMYAHMQACGLIDEHSKTCDWAKS